MPRRSSEDTVTAHLELRRRSRSQGRAGEKLKLEDYAWLYSPAPFIIVKTYPGLCRRQVSFDSIPIEPKDTVWN